VRELVPVLILRFFAQIGRANESREYKWKVAVAAALDQIPGMHCVLGLQENIVTGMADGYYRIAGQPACTLLLIELMIDANVAH
jgi:hypothetical protein